MIANEHLVTTTAPVGNYTVHYDLLAGYAAPAG